MRFQKQDLTEEDWGGVWRHGRCWIAPGSWDDMDYDPRTLGLEWSLFGSQSTGVEIELGGYNGEWSGLISVARLFGFYWHTEGELLPTPLRLLRSEEAKLYGSSLSIRYHDGAFWWSLWMPNGHWASTDPKWRRGSWHWKDTLFGKRQVEQEVVAREQVMIPLPEKLYPAEVTITATYSRRPRDPLGVADTWWRRANVDILEPENYVPTTMNGKYGGGPDGIYSTSFTASSVSEAIGSFVEQVLNQRLKHSRSMTWPPG